MRQPQQNRLQPQPRFRVCFLGYYPHWFKYMNVRTIPSPTSPWQLTFPSQPPSNQHEPVLQGSFANNESKPSTSDPLLTHSLICHQLPGTITGPTIPPIENCRQRAREAGMICWGFAVRSLQIPWKNSSQRVRTYGCWTLSCSENRRLVSQSICLTAAAERRTTVLFFDI
jgi:hypothetical protein